jgi:hypothetical protein
MRGRFRLWAFVAALACSLLGCGPAFRVPENPERLILYSIDGRECEPRNPPKDDEYFLDFPVQGKVEITDPEARREILAGLKGIKSNPPFIIPGCFSPRHGVRVVEKGTATDFAICFQCGNARAKKAGEGPIPGLLDDRSQEAFRTVLNKHLKAADVPLVPGAEK